MRLTLRTLLAYLDDILDPADAHELGKKIEESEFASGLVHRIRSVTRKLRLGAPKLTGKGMGLDANTVAEYLDNTLPQDRIPDFEKVCLESDVHLAEVASCHQILTLVLGEPADVDPALREHVRSLLKRSEGSAAQESPRPTPEETAGKPVAPPIESPPIESPRSQWEDATDVPSVTRVKVGATPSGSTIRVWPIVGTLVVAFLLALVALVAIGPLDRNHPVLGRFFADVPSDQAAAANDNPAQPGATALPPTAGTIRESATGRPGDGDEAASLASTEPATKSLPDQEVPGATGLTTADDAEAQKKALSAAGGGTLPLPPAPGKEDRPPGDAEREPDMPSPAPDVPATSEKAGAGAPKMEPEGDLPKEPTDAAAEPLAHYVSELHVLSRFDSESETWVRLATHDPVGAGERLIVLPTYRPQIVFASGLQVVVIGPAELQLIEADAEGTPGIALEFGNLVVVTDGKPGSRLNLQIGKRLSRVAFEDLDSTLALAVRRYVAPGSDPTEREGYWLIDAHATAGRLTWQDEGTAEPARIDAGQVAAMVGMGTPVVATPPAAPEWVDARNMRPIDRTASEQLETLLQLNRPLTISLLEQVTNRLVEVRTLAIRSLSLFDEFDPYVNAFNAKDLRTVWWKDLRDSLRAAAARDVDTATKIQATFERLRGEEGGKLFRMLWGYSPEQLAGGAAGELVQSLDSPSMDMRVLAFLNLNQITEKTNAYQPEYEPRRQRRAIASWERDMRQGEIKYKTPPLEIAEGDASPL